MGGFLTFYGVSLFDTIRDEGLSLLDVFLVLLGLAEDVLFSPFVIIFFPH